MDKKQIMLAAFALFTVVLFLLESFSVGFLRTGILPFQGGNTPQAQQAITENGIAELEATVAYYESYLVSRSSLTQPDIDLIKQNAKVLSITNSQQGYVIEVRTKEDIPEVYEYLTSINVNATGMANLVPPSLIQVNLTSGRAIATYNNEGLLLRLDIPPSISPGSKVRIKVAVQTQNNAITAYGRPQLAPVQALLNATAVIANITSIDTVFTIPWGDRHRINTSQLREEYGNTAISYDRKDIVILTPPLTVGQIKEKKRLAYVTFITENSITVNQSFNSKETIRADFEGFNVTFPNSILRISAGSAMKLPYPGETKYSYEARIKDAEGLSDRKIILTLDREYGIGHEVNVSINAEMLAGQAPGILSVEVLD